MGSIRNIEGFKTVIVFPARADFGEGNDQRARLASEMAKTGQMVLFGTLNHMTDDIEVVSKVRDHLYLMNQDLFPFLPHMATPEETILYMSGPMDNTVAVLLHPSKTIVEIDGGNHRDDPISPEAQVLVVRVGKNEHPATSGWPEGTVFLEEGKEEKAAKYILTILKEKVRENDGRLVKAG